IGAGQTIHLFIISEVKELIKKELGATVEHLRSSASHIPLIYTGRPELDVPAWLLINSMRMETLQLKCKMLEHLEENHQKYNRELLMIDQ
ncbi:MAG: hypothetical protein ACK53Y_02070, partial [bacterium]